MTRSDIADYLGVSEPNNQAVFRMKLTPKNDRFQGDALAPDESKFESTRTLPPTQRPSAWRWDGQL
jgi:hypothetical protein